MTQAEYAGILSMAIANEIEAYEFYRNASEIIQDAGLKTVFADLAKDELKHKVLLEGYVNGSAELSFDETRDYKVSESVETKKLSTTMTFADAIALAMKKEEEAMNMYKEFALSSADSKQKEMFMELSKMESGHKAKLEEIFVNAAFVEVW